jgi:putative peptidoglycan lipid II flippase
MPLSGTSESRGYLARNAAIISGMSFIGILLGLVLDAVIVAVLGLGAETDAFFVACAIPVIIVSLVQLQAKKVLLPLFIHLREAKGEHEAWRFLNVIMNAGFLVLCLIAVLASLASTFLVRIQAPGFNAATLSLASKLSVILFLVPPIQCQNSALSNALNALHNFTLPAMSHALENVVKLCSVLLLSGQMGIQSLAYGSLAGALVQCFILHWALMRKGFRYKPIFAFRDTNLVRACKLMLYPALGNTAALGIQILQNFLASFLPLGSLSAFRYAKRIIDAMSGVLAEGVVTVVLPMASRNLATNDVSGMKESIRKGAHLLILICLPLSAWLALMNKPLIALAFERLRFTAQDTSLVGCILVLMIPYIFFSRLLGLVETGFFGSADTRTPFMNNLFLAGLHAALSLGMYGALGVYSFPLATSLSYICSAVSICFLLWRRFGDFEIRLLYNHTFKVFLSTVVMAATIAMGRYGIPDVGSGFGQKLISLGLPSILGAFGLFAGLFKWGEIKWSDVRELRVTKLRRQGRGAEVHPERKAI